MEEKLFTFCGSMTAGCYTSDVMYVSPPELRGEDNSAAATGPRNYGAAFPNGTFQKRVCFMSSYLMWCDTK